MPLIVERNRKVHLRALVVGIVLLLLSQLPYVASAPHWLAVHDAFWEGLIGGLALRPLVDALGLFARGPYLVINEWGLQHNGPFGSSFSFRWEGIAALGASPSHDALRVVPRSHALMRRGGRLARWIRQVYRSDANQPGIYLPVRLGNVPMSAIIQALEAHAFNSRDGACPPIPSLQLAAPIIHQRRSDPASR